jgi:hypothetical protein
VPLNFLHGRGCPVAEVLRCVIGTMAEEEIEALAAIAVALQEIPGCWAPFETTTRAGRIVHYLPLAHHRFTRVDKLFICEELDGLHSLLTPTFVNEKGVERRTARGYCARYGLSHFTIGQWQNRLKKHWPLMDDPWRPSYLDSEGLAHIETGINEGNSSTVGVFDHELGDVLREEIIATKKRRGVRTYEDMDIAIGRDFERDQKKKMKILPRAAQDLTQARMKALQDIRNVYRIACLFDAFSGHLAAEHKWNTDATTAIVKRHGSGALVCYIPDKAERKALNSSRTPCELNLLVKWVMMCNAAGEQGPTTLIMTMPKMHDGEFFAQEVTGLSGTTEIGSTGWVYFCNSRAGNAALWRHWFQHIVMPTLAKCRDAHQLKERTAEKKAITAANKLKKNLKDLADAQALEAAQALIAAHGAPAQQGEASGDSEDERSQRRKSRI